MKRLFFLLFLFPAQWVSGQRVDLPVEAYIDLSVKAYSSSPTSLLSSQLTAPARSDREKVSAIFRWITDNIAYNTRAAGRNRYSAMYEETDDDTGRIIKPLNLRVAETVLRRGMAVCDGYARLFKTLCDHAGIPSEVISGYARTGWGRRNEKFGSNHSWNVVWFDSAWHLVDATWAAGHSLSRSNEFVRQFDGRYFLTAPEQFVQDHYPEDVRWTLMPDPPSQQEFSRMPFFYKGYYKTGVQSFSPSKGVIEAFPGDTLRFQVHTSIAMGILEIVPGPQPQDTIWNDDEPVPVGGFRKTASYVVTPESGDWLYAVCNGYVVLRYRLVLRKPEEKLATLRQ